MANETLGASFSIDVTNLKAGLAQANRAIRESESEFKAAAAGMDDWSNTSDGLNAKIKSLNSITDIQKAKVNALQSEYDRLIADGLDPTSKQAVELRTKINNETAALNKNETELRKQKQALEELTNETAETAEATDEVGDKFAGLKAAGGIAAGAIAAVGAACVAAVGAFLGLAESTRESRNEMAKLETAFEAAGGSAEQAEQTFTDLYSIMGDEGAAVEAAQQLAKLSTNEETLSSMTGALTGVYATFGGSLPLEGLAEAVNHTAKLGSVQGPLADALEWSGVSVDEFNERLAECKSEQERAYLIQEQLIDLYWDAGEAYKENNAAVIASQKAQAELNDTLNELGAIAEPIMTTLKQLATELLKAITPFVKLIGDGLAGAMSGAEDAAENLAEGLTGVMKTIIDKIIAMLPTVIKTIVAIVPKLATELLAQVPALLRMIIKATGQVLAALTQVLPTIIAAIVDLVPRLITNLMAYFPDLLQAAITLLMAIVKAVPTIIKNLIQWLPEVIGTIIDALVQSIPMLTSAAVEMFMAIVDAIPMLIDALIDNLPQIISSIVRGLLHAIPQILSGALEMFFAILDAIPKLLPKLISSIPQIITAIVSGLKDGIDDVVGVGGDLVTGIWNGIKDKTDWIIKKIKGFGESVLKGLKSFFGIHSPSRVMADEIGKNLALGVGVGFEENIAGVNKKITGALNYSSAGQVGNIGGGIGGGVTVYQTNNYSQAHSRVELYKTKQATAAAVRLALAGV